MNLYMDLDKIIREIEEKCKKFKTKGVSNFNLIYKNLMTPLKGSKELQDLGYDPLLKTEEINEIINLLNSYILLLEKNEKFRKAECGKGFFDIQADPKDYINHALENLK